MKKLVLLSLLVVSPLVVFATAARAQFAIYAMGSAGRLSGYPTTSTTGITTVINPSNNFWAYGGTVGIYNNFLKLGPIKLGGDIRGFSQTSSSTQGISNHLRGGLIGLRLAGSAPLIPFKPYLQAEIGGASTNYGVNTSNTGGLAYQIQGGLDFTVFPHLDLRAEYGVGQFTVLGGLGTSKSNTLQQLGIGAAIRF